MLALPPAATELLHRLTRLPGIGPKAAERLALALLTWDVVEVEALAEGLRSLRERVTECPQCGCLAQDGELCMVCSDNLRDPAVLCVVETSLDAIAVERGGSFEGLYHVLGGALSPLRGVLPEDLRIESLLTRVREGGVREVIVATNPSPDGEATALYLKQELAALSEQEGSVVRITRLARGLPSGGHLDYADAATLQSALEHRVEM